MAIAFRFAPAPARFGATLALTVAALMGCSSPAGGSGGGSVVDVAGDAASDGAGLDGGGAGDVDAGPADSATGDSTQDGGEVTDALDAGDGGSDGNGDTADAADTADTAETAADTEADAPKPGPDSCYGGCGGYDSSKNCACDLSCVDFGDCCADYVAVCACVTDGDCGGGKCATASCIDGFCDSEELVDCDDDNDCTDDFCETTTGACKNVATVEGASCDVSAVCMEGGSCKAGACTGGTPVPDGDSCEDGNPCTDDDECGKTGCIAGGPTDCDDDDMCTLDSCEPANGCTSKPTNEGKACDDGNSCTEGDACNNGACVAKPKAKGAPCDDEDDCTGPDACDGVDFCEGPDLPAGTACDDGDPCTSGDGCELWGCDGPDDTCNDGNDCTDDDCDSKSGACSAPKASDGSKCQDGDPCTVGDACASGTCKASTTSACDDSDPCTLDACTAEGDNFKCSLTPSQGGTTCDDGDPCTKTSTCVAGLCKGTDTCTSLFSDAFTCGDKAWTFAPAVSAKETGWQVDGNPDPPAAKSAPCSLNFNDGKSFPGDPAAGTATSPAVAIPAGKDALVMLWSWHDVEQSKSYDQRFIEIVVGGSVVQSVQLDNDAPEKTWALLTAPIKGQGGKSVQVRLRFDSKDGTSNDGAGWFVDDLKVVIAP